MARRRVHRTRKTREPLRSPRLRSPRPRAARAQWRETLDSWGGLTVIGGVGLAVVLAGFLILRTPLGFSQSDEALLGEAYPDVSANHVAEGSLTDNSPQPPAGGSHYPRPATPGIFEETIADGYLVHALEHGMVWFSYQPGLLSDEQLTQLQEVANDYSNDVILAPRPANDAALYALSWGRRLAANPDDVDLLRQFVETNRNRSPEPGVR